MTGSCGPLDLDPIRARAEAATPGPWTTVETDDGRFYGQAPTLDIWAKRSDGEYETVVSGGPVEDGGPVLGACEPEDAEFIAAARTDVPALVAEVVSLRAQLAAVEQLADEYEADYNHAGHVSDVMTSTDGVARSIRASLAASRASDEGGDQ